MFHLLTGLLMIICVRSGGKYEDVDIINQFENVRKYLYDIKKGLYYHAYDEAGVQKWADKTTGQSPNFWLRSMGWYLMALDGCNVVQILIKIITPMLKPAMVSCALFQFMWSSNDFMGPLLYVKTPANYPAAIFVKLSMDADTGFEWNRVLAVSLISIIPSLFIFFLAQNSFIEGISAGSVKG